MTVQNKSQMISSLKRQIELEMITYNLLKVQKEIHQCSDAKTVDLKLTQLAKNYSLEYRTDQYLRYEKHYNQIKSKYKRDKEFLASVMNSLQGPHKMSGTGGVQVLRQYNQDVRLMRENDEMLRRYEGLLKQA